MNWPLWLFIVMGLGLVILFWKTTKFLFLAILAIVIWLALDLNVWDWLPTWLFWIIAILAVVLAFIGLGLGRFLSIVAIILAASVALWDVAVAEWDIDWFQDDETRQVVDDGDLTTDGSSPSTDDTSTTDAEVTTTTDEEDEDSTTSSTSTTTTVPDAEQPLSTETLRALTITKPETPCVKLVRESGQEVFETDNGSRIYWSDLKVLDDQEKWWTDAVSTAFTAEEDSAKFTELLTENCTNSYTMLMVAHYFANHEIHGPAIVERNPWLKPLVGLPEDIVHVLAAKYEIKPVPVIDPNHLTSEDEAAIDAMIARSLEMQELAGKVNTLLTKFKLAGVQALPSTLNYHIPAEEALVDGIPRLFYNDQQEDMPALILVLTEKDACVPVWIIGFNVADKRLEEFAPPSCDTPPPSTTAPPTTQPTGSTTPPTTAPTTTVPTGSTTTTSPTTTTPSTTTTVPTRCEGDKPRWVDSNGNGRVDPGECVPPLSGGTTVPPPATTSPSTATTTATTPHPTTPATSPSTSAPPVTPPSTAPTSTVVY